MLEIGTAGATGDGGGGHGGGFGLVLRGGTHQDASRCRPLTVSRVIPHSPADRSTTVMLRLIARALVKQ